MTLTKSWVQVATSLAWWSSSMILTKSRGEVTTSGPHQKKMWRWPKVGVKKRLVWHDDHHAWLWPKVGVKWRLVWHDDPHSWFWPKVWAKWRLVVPTRKNMTLTKSWGQEATSRIWWSSSMTLTKNKVQIWHDDPHPWFWPKVGAKCRLVVSTRRKYDFDQKLGSRSD